MSSGLLITKTSNTPREMLQLLLVHKWSWRTTGAVCGFFFGVLCPILGSILTAIAWFTGSNWHGLRLRSYGTVLFVLTIPLLVFGAHCLDLMDQRSGNK